jgi:outer membrane protein assembly factor BamB
MRSVVFAAVTLSLGSAAAEPEFVIDNDANSVLRRDAGKVTWSRKLDGYLGLVRPPHLVSDADRVYVTNDGGVTALDARTGKVLWHSPGPEDQLYLSGDLLLAGDCSGWAAIKTRGRWVLARSVKDGSEVFRVRLRNGDAEPLPVRELAGSFLVRLDERPGQKEESLLVDRKGHIVLRLDRRVLTGKATAGSYVFLTSRDVYRVSADKGVAWTIPFREPESAAGGGLVELEGGDLVAYRFSWLRDSGVQVTRFNPATGKVVWQTHCASLGGLHSEYEHRATVAVEGGRVKVTSRGSGGTFVEVLDAKTGRQLERSRPERGRDP